MLFFLLWHAYCFQIFKPEYIQANAASFLDHDWINIASLRDYLAKKTKSTQTAPASSLFSHASSSLPPSQPASSCIKHEDIDSKTVPIIKSEPNDASTALRKENPAVKTQIVSSQGIDYIEILSSDDEDNGRYVFAISNMLIFAHVNIPNAKPRVTATFHVVC